MFQAQHKPTNGFYSAMATLSLIYHVTVRRIRGGHRNAVIGMLLSMLQAMLLVAMFVVLFQLLGLKKNAVRGDFLLYIMSGIFLFMTHNKAISAVISTDGPTSSMMLHAPMNTIISLCAASLSALYQQILAMSCMLFIYHVVMTPITIEQPVGAVGMLILAWFSGVAVGTIFLAIKPWFPTATGIISMVYMRANMLSSGKMFLANTLPSSMLVMFDWNPLFHCIDQARGFVFLNYNPHFSSITYPVYISLALLMIGLMGEFYTRQHVSKSWSAR